MTSQQHITVLLADDHIMVREGLRHLLSLEGDIEVVGEAANGREAVEQTRKLHPDVVIMDVAMPLMNGLDATRQIRKAFPKTKVLILSARSNNVYVKHAKDFGASGYLLKHISVRCLSAAIRKVHQGGVLADPETPTDPREQQRDLLARERLHNAKAAPLSLRETEVLRMTVEGLTNKEIAEAMGLSARTTEKYRCSLMQKLTIHDTAGLTRYAIDTGIVDTSVSV